MRQTGIVQTAVRWSTGRARAGAACVLIVVMLIAFIIAAAVTVDFAYMQLIRTELRSATDAAAKAGAEALARTQNPDAARQAAVTYAAANRVGGSPFQITTSDVSIGRVNEQTGGKLVFSPNATPYNAVRVDARVGSGGTTAAKPTFFGAILGRPTYSTRQQATAARQEVEVCLCLDRSGSMMYDMTGIDGVYPADNPYLLPLENYPDTTTQSRCSPPHPTDSRWAALRSAIQVYLNEAQSLSFQPRTALVTWSEDSTLSYYPFLTYPVAETNHALPPLGSFSWAANRAAIESELTSLSANAVSGRTNLSAGLDLAVQELTTGNSRPLCIKVVILLTDGIWNSGRDPLEAAADAAAAGVVVHTISMLTETQTVLTQVAAATGGNYYPTSNQLQLQQAFREIARSLPVVLSD
jgi:Ca-activated chloride channel homolog